MAILMALAVHAPPSPHDVNDRIPLALSNLVMNLLAKDPNDRISSANEVLTILQSIDKSSTLAQPEDSVTQPVLPPSPLLSEKVVPSVTPFPPSPIYPLPTPTRVLFKPRILLLGVVLLSLATLAYAFLGSGSSVNNANLPNSRVDETDSRRIAQTETGTLFVQLDDSTVEISVKANDILFHDKTTKREFTLPPGQGVVEVFKKTGEVLTRKTFTLASGSKANVQILLPPRQVPIDLVATPPKKITTQETKPKEPEPLKDNHSPKGIEPVAISLLRAEEFTASITAVKDGRVTFQKYKKGEKGMNGEKEGGPITLPVAKSATIAKMKFNTQTKKSEAGDKLEGGLANEVFRSGNISLSARITTDADSKYIMQILTLGTKKKAN